MTSENQPNKSTDLYEEITAKIILALEDGVASWQRPWKEVAAQGSMRNAITETPYRGINVLLLGIAAQASGYTDPRWCTFKQAKTKGWTVRKGEKSTTICRYQPIDVVDKEKFDENGDPLVRQVKLLRSYHVFNAAQLEVGPEPLKVKDLTEEELIEQQFQISSTIESILERSGAVIRHGGDRAYYRPSNDTITLPDRENFHTQEGYYGTALHELGHWSGHSSRLDRDLTGSFGTPSYAKEELRAELASSFLTAEYGVPGSSDNHAAYVKSWIEVLKNDKREIFKAASDAQKIASFIKEFITPELSLNPKADPKEQEAQALGWDSAKQAQENEEIVKNRLEQFNREKAYQDTPQAQERREASGVVGDAWVESPKASTKTLAEQAEDDLRRAGIDTLSPAIDHLVRDATTLEKELSVKAPCELDLNRRPTGWKSVPIENGNGTLLVSDDGLKAVPFISKDLSSGTEGLRAKAKAQAFAIDNPYVSTVAQNELLVTPLVAKEQSAEEKIREAFRAIESVSLGQWYPIKVSANGVDRELLACQKQLKSNTQENAILHLVHLKKGKLFSTMPTQIIANYYQLTSANQLIDDGRPSTARQEQIDKWKESGLTLPEIPKTPKKSYGMGM